MICVWDPRRLERIPWRGPDSPIQGRPRPHNDINGHLLYTRYLSLQVCLPVSAFQGTHPAPPSLVRASTEPIPRISTPSTSQERHTIVFITANSQKMIPCWSSGCAAMAEKIVCHSNVYPMVKQGIILFIRCMQISPLPRTL